MNHGTKTLLKYSTLSSAKTSWEFTETPQIWAAGQNWADSLCSLKSTKFWFHLSDTPTDSYHHSAFTYRQKHPESDPMHYLVEKHQLNSTIRCKHSKVKETETITQEEYIHDWQQKVTQVKKLTYFHSIKSDYKLAPYLSIIKGYGQRKLLTKYRLSEHSLCVETGRHKQSWRPRELRLCSHCTDGLIEDELHFLTECSKYKHIRDAYFKQIALVSPECQQTSNTEKLSYILGEKEKCIHLAAQYVHSCHQMRDNGRTLRTIIFPLFY